MLEGQSGLEASTEKLNVSHSLKICGNGTVSHNLVQGQVQKSSYVAYM